jgi:hypothetical protein
MGDVRPDNGGGVPPEEGGSHPQHLPGFPPEWGPVIIPDDASELDDDALALRRELRRTGRRSRLRSVLGIPNTGGERPPSLGVPVVIMAVAVLTTLVSLFVVTWGRQPSQPSPPVASGTRQVNGARLGDLVFADAAGTQVRLGQLFPAVLLLVDDCVCEPLILDVAAQAPAGVTVVPVAVSAPTLLESRLNVRPLADPDRVLQDRYGGGAVTPSPTYPTQAQTAASATASPGPTVSVGPSQPPARAAAVLVDKSGSVTSTVTVVESAADIGPALKRLGG